jgi:hypothetical protein
MHQPQANRLFAVGLFFCLEDAVNLYNKADFEHAKKRAINSLRYSVGIFHPDYKKASA